MTDAEILDLLREAIDEVAPGRSHKLDARGLDTRMRDLELDSVQAMELVGVVEERLDVSFPEEDLARLDRLADLAALIRRHGR